MSEGKSAGGGGAGAGAGISGRGAGGAGGTAAADAWIEVICPSTQRVYYFNEATEETSWAPPDGGCVASTTEGLYDPHKQRLHAAKKGLACPDTPTIDVKAMSKPAKLADLLHNKQKAAARGRARQGSVERSAVKLKKPALRPMTPEEKTRMLDRDGTPRGRGADKWKGKNLFGQRR